VANINVDPWQNPLPVRLQPDNPAENFFSHVFRWEDIFTQLLNPLKENRSIHLATRLIRSDADVYYDHVYKYEQIDFLLIDAIFLFQERFNSFYDYKVWIDCSFETGLERAISRNVENLDKEQLIHDYHTCYYAAQRLHFKKDHPRENANLIFDNDLLPELT